MIMIEVQGTSILHTTMILHTPSIFHLLSLPLYLTLTPSGAVVQTTGTYVHGKITK